MQRQEIPKTEEKNGTDKAIIHNDPKTNMINKNSKSYQTKD